MAFRFPKLTFSLRLLLVLVTALCIALGVWIAPRERQRRAVEAIEAAGGWEYYGSEGRLMLTTSDSLLRRWLPKDYTDDVEEVWFSPDPPITDDVLVHLKALPKLRSLQLGNTPITDAHLVHLHGLTELRSLDLTATQITDAGLAHLEGLRSLENLSLDFTQVTDDGVTRLREALPNCEIYTEK
ncbi:MAG TPA: hypothetical protein VHC22_20940 [Pirellulales bacterium]|nr:hypothetical protein [Pirellulales bacterium]